MKRSPIYFIGILLILVFAFYQCSCGNENSISKGKSQKFNEIDTISLQDLTELENEVINQTLPLILDSLHKQIELNIKTSINKLDSIYYVDSLLNTRYSYTEIKQFFLDWRQDIDTICIHKGRIKLSLEGANLRNTVKLLPLSSIASIEEMTKKNNNKYVLMIFTRVNFNKEKTLGFFNLDLSCSYNAGLEYAVLVVKVNNKWLIKRIIESAVS